MAVYETIECLYCGKKTKRRKYCSSACNNAYHSKLRKEARKQTEAEEEVRMSAYTNVDCSKLGEFSLAEDPWTTGVLNFGMNQMWGGSSMMPQKKQH